MIEKRFGSVLRAVAIAIFLWIGIVGGAIALFAPPAVADASSTAFSAYVDEAGHITRPTGFREDWSHLGTWSVPDGETLMFHEVYAEAETVNAYRETGEFPDGAALVKEIRQTESADMTTGNPSWAVEPAIWFVMIKDKMGRFADNPNWGEGWGWALYKADNPSLNVSTSFEADCLSCHLPAKETDYIYSYAYPTLREAQ
ncbi:MAG: cytochrome P460 family protein [Leptolyngbyaceae bacterium]|nr:cytochrome P460 family protein [Leptolyngbyaceae bacterium]